MKKKVWSFILLMVCAFGIWMIYEKAPVYRLVQGTKVLVKDINSFPFPGVAGEKDLVPVIFRSLPIVAFGVGIYFLFLRQRKEG